MTKISELKAGDTNVNVVAEIEAKGEVRDVQKYNKSLRVCELILKDKTGSIAFTLWGDNIDKVRIGDKLSISSAYVGSFSDKPVLTLGKTGTMESV